MATLEQLVNRYEDMEINKDLYLGHRNYYESLIDDCIKNHDLDSLNRYINEFMELNQKHNLALITANLNRIDHINMALHNESAYDFPMFWEDTSCIRDLINKYDKTIFMIRRLTFNLPDLYKSEALKYLKDISPFIIREIYNDETTLVGKEDFIYLTLAMEHIKSQDLYCALIFLENTKNKNDQVRSFILQLKTKLTDIGDLYG